MRTTPRTTVRKEDDGGRSPQAGAPRGLMDRDVRHGTLAGTPREPTVNRAALVSGTGRA